LLTAPCFERTFRIASFLVPAAVRGAAELSLLLSLSLSLDDEELLEESLSLSLLLESLSESELEDDELLSSPPADEDAPFAAVGAPAEPASAVSSVLGRFR
jgi:hypothetical protein